MGALDILGAASGSLYLVTMTALGVRLLFLSRRNQTKPELWLAVAFLAGGSFGASSEVVGARFLAESHPVAAFWVVGLGKLASAIGLRSYDWSSPSAWRVRSGSPASRSATGARCGAAPRSVSPTRS